LPVFQPGNFAASLSHSGGLPVASTPPAVFLGGLPVASTSPAFLSQRFACRLDTASLSHSDGLTNSQHRQPSFSAI